MTLAKVMIGVRANPSQSHIVREFFELFKTPWEFCIAGRSYDVTLCSDESEFTDEASLIIYYSGRPSQVDARAKIRACQQVCGSVVLSYRGRRFPIYNDSVTFPDTACTVLTSECSHLSLLYKTSVGGRRSVRIGYDLFTEIDTLLRTGQPLANAHTPTLEIHIGLLRDLITECGLPFFEIPPIPHGYRFIACLTHDVDHPSIQRHRWDHTLFGFLYRASLGSIYDMLRGRISICQLLRNWHAILRLPFIHLGIARDFWNTFAERYLEIESRHRSTFFVIPFRDEPGSHRKGRAPRSRATRYGAEDIAGILHKLKAAGCEIGLHGIDAWRDTDAGHRELTEIRRLTGASEIGVRMHWLYYSDSAAKMLEKAGASYDSTVGYNATIGYRAGTTQVFKPYQTVSLLELPLHVMDTALFYPVYLGVSPRSLMTSLKPLIDDVTTFGGCLTFNWHDRSVLPERQWDVCYRSLLNDLNSNGAWLCTAAQAVAWFRRRRLTNFEWCDGGTLTAIRACVPDNHATDLPQLMLRRHEAKYPDRLNCAGGASFVDDPIDEPTRSTFSDL